MTFTIPFLRVKHFSPEVVALLRAGNRTGSCMTLSAAGMGSFATAYYFYPHAELPVPFLVIGQLSVVFLVAALVIQWRAQRAFLAAVGEEA